MSTSNNNQVMPVVQEGILAYRKDGRDYRLRVSTPAWYSWLDTARTFAFRSGAGTFTACKEQAGHKRGGWYWRAYCKRGGKLHSAYIGTAEELTMERLTVVAAALAREVEDEHNLGAGVSEKQGPHRGGVITHEGAHAEYPSSQPSAARPVLERLNRPSSTLPVPLTSLIGREREIAAACTRLSRPETRLLTLTGTGGVGKTRLALAIAARMQEEFQEGVCFVSLAPMQDANLVLPALVQALGLYATGTASPLEHLQAALRERHLLVLLDNFEQVVEVAPSLVELLAACPRLKLLVTSRQVLHVRGEHEFPVQPLALPETKHLPERETLERYGAVALFLERAREIQPTFQLGDEQAPLIVEICRRLDGLPLAIELAAARLKLLSLATLLERLEKRLAVLTGGARDLPARQQTLRNTLAWSYDLLSDEEQRLFRRLAIFVGGCDLSAVEAICQMVGGPRLSILDGVMSLLDKQLLHQTEQQGPEQDDRRLRMLETIREYGMECLLLSGELEQTRRAHAEYYLQLAERAEPNLYGSQQDNWFARLEREHDNLRAAQRWFLEQGEEGERLDMALRLGGALWWFWSVRGYASEGRNFLERVPAESRDGVTVVRAKALMGAGWLAHQQGDYARAELLGKESVGLYRVVGDRRDTALALQRLGEITLRTGKVGEAGTLLEESLALAREVGDKETLAYTLLYLGFVAYDQNDYSRAEALMEESLALFSQPKNTVGRLFALLHLGRVLFAQGDDARAGALVEESLALSRETDLKSGIATALDVLGQFALFQGEAHAAESLLEESLALFRELGEQRHEAYALSHLARVAAVQSDEVTARALYEESLMLFGKLKDTGGMVACLQEWAGVVARRGEAEAARLWGAAEALREASGPRSLLALPIKHVDEERMRAIVRARLGEQAFARILTEGRAMTPEQAWAAQGYPARANRPPARSKAGRQQLLPSSPPDDLTGREMEVLHLVAQGLTDAQIAEALVISPRTVNAHLRSIYSKLGITSRNAATRYALDHHLV